MSANAFGGHARLDKCNLQGPSLLGGVLLDVVSDTPGEVTLWCSVIKDAVDKYLFFGLRRNGPKREEFWSACEFLFNVRASKPETWQDAREQGISDELLKFMCLDSISSYINLGMPLDVFINKLQAERKALLQKNWQQVAAHLNLYQDYSECEAALVAPETPDTLTDLLYTMHSTEMAVAA